MVFTNAQTTAFFEAIDQMGLTAPTRDQLQTEGLITVGDLEEFDVDDLKQIAANLRRPSGRVPHPTIAGETIPTPLFEFGAKSLNRLTAASDIVRYYQATGRSLSHTNMHWDVIKIYIEHWKSLKARKKDDKPEVPKITRGLPVVKWTEAFEDYLHQNIGSHFIPLAYVICTNNEVPAGCCPYSSTWTTILYRAWPC
jgi:hypothetical protein